VRNAWWNYWLLLLGLRSWFMPAIMCQGCSWSECWKVADKGTCDPMLWSNKTIKSIKLSTL
jgi:hypothetical protein